jgi:hypothetical protein
VTTLVIATLAAIATLLVLLRFAQYAEVLNQEDAIRRRARGRIERDPVGSVAHLLSVLKMCSSVKAAFLARSSGQLVLVGEYWSSEDDERIRMNVPVAVAVSWSLCLDAYELSFGGMERIL